MYKKLSTVKPNMSHLQDFINTVIKKGETMNFNQQIQVVLLLLS